MKLYIAKLVDTHQEGASTIVTIMIDESFTLVQYVYWFLTKDELTIVRCKIVCGSEVLDIVEINHQTLFNIVSSNSESSLKKLSKPMHENTILNVFGSYSLMYKSIVHHIPSVMLYCLGKK